MIALQESKLAEKDNEITALKEQLAKALSR